MSCNLHASCCINKSLDLNLVLQVVRSTVDSGLGIAVLPLSGAGR